MFQKKLLFLFYGYQPCAILVPTSIEMYSSYLHEHPRETVDPTPNYGFRADFSRTHEGRKKKERLEVSPRRLGADQAAPQPAGARPVSDGHQSLLRTGPSSLHEVFHRQRSSKKVTPTSDAD